VQQVSGADDVTTELAHGTVTLLDLLPADGVVTSLDSQQAGTGQVPGDKAVRALVEAARATLPRSQVGVFASEALAEDHPQLAALMPDVAGVVVVAMPGPDDHVVWFRGEVAQTVDWLGDQSLDNRPDPLSPRNSFALWRQTVRGRAVPWDERALAEVEELGRDLSGVLLRRVEAHLAHLGLHDPLTGLPNRRLFLDRLQHALHRHGRGATAAVLFVDLDRFKLVNDSLGHEVGDRVLVRAGEVIAAAVRESDTVARLGGDEFVVLCEDLEVDSVRDLADRLVTDLQRPLEVDGHDLRVSASVGVAVAAGHQLAAELLREADIAMYQAKEQGRNQVSPFHAGMRYRALRRLDLDQALRRGLQRDELLVHYQPIVAPATGEVRGLEALLRWQRPEIGLVPPDHFVPVAEDTGFMVPLGEWVLAQALRQLAEWTDAGVVRPGLPVAVNLSARQLLDRGLPGLVTGLLRDAGVAPSRLHLAITESVCMSERPTVNVVVQGLVDAGAVLVIDDFGTGYSSLAYLRQIPARQLKIDRRFIRRLGGDRRDRSLVAAVTALAREFDLETVAEGVETEEQREQVVELGCDLAQGYLFARPQGPTEVARWLADPRREGVTPHA
jgi:diguanylate cyclase (GGDEF)-like protein